MEFTLIILRLLWRYAPVQWLEVIVAYLIDWATSALETEEHRAWLDEHPRNAQWYGGWLAIIEARLDELIELKAYRLLKRRWPVRIVPAHQPLHSVRSASDGYCRLVGIYLRFEDHERLARVRAEKLKRLFEVADPLGLVDPGSAEAAPVVPLSAGLHLCARLCAGFAPAFSAQRIRAPP